MSSKRATRTPEQQAVPQQADDARQLITDFVESHLGEIDLDAQGTDAIGRPIESTSWDGCLRTLAGDQYPFDDSMVITLITGTKVRSYEWVLEFGAGGPKLVFLEARSWQRHSAAIKRSNNVPSDKSLMGLQWGIGLRSRSSASARNPNPKATLRTPAARAQTDGREEVAEAVDQLRRVYGDPRR